MIDLLHAVSDEIKRYCIENGALQDAACDPLPLQDIIPTFGMARHIASTAGCAHFVVLAPRGTACAYFFRELRCKVIEIYHNDQAVIVPSCSDLASITKRRVTLLVDDADIESVTTVVQALLPFSPSEIWLYICGTSQWNNSLDIDASIAQFFLTQQVFNYAGNEELEKDFAVFFKRLVPRLPKKCAVAKVGNNTQKSCYTIGRVLKPFFNVLQQKHNDWTEHNNIDAQDGIPHLPTMSAGMLADYETFLYFTGNIFKPGSFNLISTNNPAHLLPLSLMLLLKYSRGSRISSLLRRSMFVSLAHPVDVAERLMSFSLGRDLSRIMTGNVTDRDWPKLVRAAGTVMYYEMDFLQRGIEVDPAELSAIIRHDDAGYGLVVVCDAIGQLASGITDQPIPVQWLEQLRSLASGENVPVIVIATDFTRSNHGTGYFDYELMLKEHPESNFLQYVKPENIQHPGLCFMLSPVHGIMEDSPANFTSCIPSNYNTEPVSRN